MRPRCSRRGRPGRVAAVLRGKTPSRTAEQVSRRIRPSGLRGRAVRLQHEQPWRQPPRRPPSGAGVNDSANVSCLRSSSARSPSSCRTPASSPCGLPLRRSALSQFHHLGSVCGRRRSRADRTSQTGRRPTNPFTSCRRMSGMCRRTFRGKVSVTDGGGRPPRTHGAEVLAAWGWRLFRPSAKSS